MNTILSYPLSFNSDSCDSTKAMGNPKWTNDWKFWMQLVTIAVLAGVAWQENRQMQRKVETLELNIEVLQRMNHEKTEVLIRMEGKFDLLKQQIEQLKERLEAKKVVNVASGFNTVADGPREAQ